MKGPETCLLVSILDHHSMYAAFREPFWKVAGFWIKGFEQFEQNSQLMTSDQAGVIRALAGYVCIAWKYRKDQLVSACMSE